MSTLDFTVTVGMGCQWLSKVFRTRLILDSKAGPLTKKERRNQNDILADCYYEYLCHDLNWTFLAKDEPDVEAWLRNADQIDNPKEPPFYPMPDQIMETLWSIQQGSAYPLHELNRLTSVLGTKYEDLATGILKRWLNHTHGAHYAQYHDIWDSCLAMTKNGSQCGKMRRRNSPICAVHAKHRRPYRIDLAIAIAEMIVAEPSVLVSTVTDGVLRRDNLTRTFRLPIR